MKINWKKAENRPSKSGEYLCLITEEFMGETLHHFMVLPYSSIWDEFNVCDTFEASDVCEDAIDVTAWADVDRLEEIYKEIQ